MSQPEMLMKDIETRDWYLVVSGDNSKAQFHIRLYLHTFNLFPLFDYYTLRKFAFPSQSVMLYQHTWNPKINSTWTTTGRI